MIDGGEDKVSFRSFISTFLGRKDFLKSFLIERLKGFVALFLLPSLSPAFIRRNEPDWLVYLTYCGIIFFAVLCPLYLIYSLWAFWGRAKERDPGLVELGRATHYSEWLDVINRSQ